MANELTEAIKVARQDAAYTGKEHGVYLVKGGPRRYYVDTAAIGVCIAKIQPNGDLKWC